VERHYSGRSRDFQKSKSGSSPRSRACSEISPGFTREATAHDGTSHYGENAL
jgi:hypothetical protein